MPVDLVRAAEVLEAAMLVAFGVAWPVDILRTLRTRRVEGKSLAFMGLILAGYGAGLAAKLLRAADAGAWPEVVSAMYVVNGLLVAADMALVAKYRRMRKPECGVRHTGEENG